MRNVVPCTKVPAACGLCVCVRVCAYVCMVRECCCQIGSTARSIAHAQLHRGKTTHIHLAKRAVGVGVCV